MEGFPHYLPCTMGFSIVVSSIVLLKSNLIVNLIIVLILIYYLISLIDDKFKLDPSPNGKGSDIKRRSPPP
jgi:UDP-N-acetylmuramyl pentapeptide phosphotransferase/UDP-N-acetylglucosamine-1-phosphate transferase